MFKNLSLSIVALLTVASFAQADDAIKGDPYPLNICAVAGEELGSMGDPIVFNHQGRDIRFCCIGCKPRFEGAPAKFLADVDAKIIEQQQPHYPLTTDIVSGDALPADAKAINLVYFNRLVRFGDQKNVQKFLKEPDGYLAKLDEAVIATQKDSYPLDTCIISGEPLDAMGEPILKVYANHLVQFCCESCVKKFAAQPGKFWSALDKGEVTAPLSHSEIYDEKKSEH